MDAGNVSVRLHGRGNLGAKLRESGNKSGGSLGVASALPIIQDTASACISAPVCRKLRIRMLTLSEISKAYGGRVLFADVTLQVNREDRIGLVGPNGAGKTTLFSIILGDGSADAGEVTKERNVSV